MPARYPSIHWVYNFLKTLNDKHFIGGGGVLDDENALLLLRDGLHLSEASNGDETDWHHKHTFR